MTARPCEACGSVEFRSLYSKEAHDFHRCRSCALIRIDPQPTDAVLASIYGTKYYDAWGVQSGAERVFALKKATFRQHVFSELPLAKGARILDCGAAFGDRGHLQDLLGELPGRRAFETVTGRRPGKIGRAHV